MHIANQRGITVAELRATQAASDFEQQWQDFLLNGFPEWLPHAFIVAPKFKDTTPRQVLQWMIAEWVSPSNFREDMSDDDLHNGLKVMAQKMGTTFK